ncbi:hypothetical protein Tco_0912820, partial [Tanacetum coccineum]
VDESRVIQITKDDTIGMTNDSGAMFNQPIYAQNYIKIIHIQRKQISRTNLIIKSKRTVLIFVVNDHQTFQIEADSSVESCGTPSRSFVAQTWESTAKRRCHGNPSMTR